MHTYSWGLACALRPTAPRDEVAVGDRPSDQSIVPGDTQSNQDFRRFFSQFLMILKDFNCLPLSGFETLPQAAHNLLGSTQQIKSCSYVQFS